MAACKTGDLPAVQRLLQAGANAATDGNAPLRWAAENGHTAVVKALLALPLDRGVRPGADDNYALCCAAYHGHIAVLKELLALPWDRGVRPGARDNYTLRRAAAKGHTAVVRALLAPRAVPVPPATLARLHSQGKVRSAYTDVRWDGTGLARARGRLLALRAVARSDS